MIKNNQMSRAVLWLGFILLTVGLASFAPPKKQPNILFILTDDLGYHDLGFTGSKIYQTPNIDRLAGEGLSFGQAFSSYPRCVPSRYGLLTGTYPVNEDNGFLAGIPAEQNFIKQFTAAGYNAYYVGKWHLGIDNCSPKGFGFTDSYAAGESGATGSRFYPFNVLKKNSGEPKPIEDVEKDGKTGDYLSDLLTGRTMQFIRDNGRDKPFLAVLAYYAVHTPLEAKPEDRERNAKEIAAFDYGDTPEYLPEGTGRRKMRQDHPDYAGMVENVDYNVGRLLDLLRELKIDDNTIVVFSSDHGGLSNDGTRKRELATTNFPLRAGKGHLYEGGIRVPLILHWNKKIKPCADPDNIILGMDVFPTLLEMATGKKVSGIDGRSYVPVLKGKENWRNRTVFWHEDKARPNSTGDTKCSVIRSGDYKLLQFYKEDRIELYNVKTDVSEADNLAQTDPERAKTMLKELKDWKKSYLIPEKMDMKKNARNQGKMQQSAGDEDEND